MKSHRPKAQLLKSVTERHRVRIKALRKLLHLCLGTLLDAVAEDFRCLAGVLDVIYDQAMAEVQRKQDDAAIRLEVEAENRTIETKEGETARARLPALGPLSPYSDSLSHCCSAHVASGTEECIKQALASKESQQELRRTAIKELDLMARQFPDNDEGLGISIEDALVDCGILVKNLVGGEEEAVRDKAAKAQKKADAAARLKDLERAHAHVLTREERKAVAQAIIIKKKRQEQKLHGKAPEGGEEKSEGV
jgi:hypothetical protein